MQLVNVPLDGVPSAGVTNVGEVANTKAPVPVSSVTAANRLALDGVAKKVATPVPNPETPDPTGRPVQLVKTPLDGVPKSGVTSVGLVALTGAPVPVAVVHTGSAVVPPPTSIWLVVPAGSVCKAPVAVVPAAISPYAVVDVVLPVPPCATVTAAAEVNIVALLFGRVKVFVDVAGPVKAVNPLAVPPFAAGSIPVTPAVNDKPVQLVKTPLAGVPKAGAVNTGLLIVGLACRTTAPVPVAPPMLASGMVSLAAISVSIGPPFGPCTKGFFSAIVLD